MFARIARSTLSAALLAGALSLALSPPARAAGGYSAALIDGGPLNDWYRDLGPCGQLVGFRWTIPVRGGSSTPWPLTRYGNDVQVLRPLGTGGEAVAVSGSGWIAGHSDAEGLSFPFVLPP
ncbi:MAG: hypothetical protein HY721_30840, partial [Planctomycetes bacterium]|nr:hypothetical protein [Planctomycetota bacterium]